MLSFPLAVELNVVMLGPPGAGKGTQAARLARTWRIPHISTGAMLREAVQSGTPLGLEVKAIMERGGLIDDETITRVVRARLEKPDAAHGFLLDGYPRTVPQGLALDEFCAPRALLTIVEISLTEADVLRRLAARMICSECGVNSQDDRDYVSCVDCGGRLVLRADDRADVVRKRLEVYRQQTAPLIDFYDGRPSYCRIDGAGLADEVTNAILKAVDEVCGPRIVR
jgi:adenylate kinase